MMHLQHIISAAKMLGARLGFPGQHSMSKVIEELMLCFFGGECCEEEMSL